MKDTSRHSSAVRRDSPPRLTEARGRLLAAVADPVRQQILWLLTEERTVAELCASLDMAQPRVSHHLAVLRRCGLVEAESRGRLRPHRWAAAEIGCDVWRVQELLRSWFVEKEADARAAEAGALEDYLL